MLTLIMSVETEMTTDVLFSGELSQKKVLRSKKDTRTNKKMQECSAYNKQGEEEEEEGQPH